MLTTKLHYNSQGFFLKWRVLIIDVLFVFWTNCLVRNRKFTVDKDLHLSWTLQRSGEICEKCTSLRWSSCDAGRSAVVGSAPEHVLSQWRSQSLWTSSFEWSLPFHWTVRSWVQTSHSPFHLFPRPLTHSDERALSYLWGRPRPTDHGTGNGGGGKRQGFVKSYFMPEWKASKHFTVHPKQSLSLRVLTEHSTEFFFICWESKKTARNRWREML